MDHGPARSEENKVTSLSLFLSLRTRVSASTYGATKKEEEEEEKEEDIKRIPGVSERANQRRVPC